MKTILFILTMLSFSIVNARPDYIEYEDGAMKKIKCMICGIDVASRSEVQSRKYPGKTFERMRIHPNYRLRKVSLNDGSSANIIICKDCMKEDTESHKDKLSDEILYGFVEQEKERGSSAEDIEKMKKKYKKIKVTK